MYYSFHISALKETFELYGIINWKTKVEYTARLILYSLESISGVCVYARVFVLSQPTAAGDFVYLYWVNGRQYEHEFASTIMIYKLIEQRYDSHDCLARLSWNKYYNNCRWIPHFQLFATNSTIYIRIFFESSSKYFHVMHVDS